MKFVFLIMTTQFSTLVFAQNQKNLTWSQLHALESFDGIQLVEDITVAHWNQDIIDSLGKSVTVLTELPTTGSLTLNSSHKFEKTKVVSSSVSLGVNEDKLVKPFMLIIPMRVKNGCKVIEKGSGEMDLSWHNGILSGYDIGEPSPEGNQSQLTFMSNCNKLVWLILGHDFDSPSPFVKE